MSAALKPVEKFYQPPRNGRTCSKCGAKTTSVKKTKLCRSCRAREMGEKTGGWNKGLKMKRRDELK